MQHEIKPAPLFGDRVVNLLQLPRYGHVAGHHDVASHGYGKRPDIGFGLRIQISDSKVGDRRAEMPGAAIGKTVLVGDADDQTLLSFGARQLGHKSLDYSVSGTPWLLKTQLNCLGGWIAGRLSFLVSGLRCAASVTLHT